MRFEVRKALKSRFSVWILPKIWENVWQRDAEPYFFCNASSGAVLQKEMLSDTAASDYDLYVDSPFAEENRLLVAATDASSRYTRRG